MTGQDSDHEQHEQELVTSLLRSLYDTNASSDQAQSLVSAGMDRLDMEPPASTPSENGHSKHGRTSRTARPWRIALLASAALILVAVCLSLLGNSNPAMAAITISIEQAFKDVGRLYSVTTQFRSSDGTESSRDSDLYVKGGNRFAVRTVGPLAVGSIWLGSEDNEAWVVPPFGPVMEGDTNKLKSWVSRGENISTPYLQITTILERMRDLYDLDILPDESIDTEMGNIDCRHIVGKLNGQGSARIPNRIELWADLDSGIARKVVAQWNLLDGESGRESITILWIAEVPLEDQFFTANGHGAKNRIRIQFNAEGNQ